MRKCTKHSFEVRRNDNIDIKYVDDFDKILFSPGPDIPKENGIMWQIIQEFKHTKSILGICLGFQAIGKYFGASLFNLKKVYHGQARQIKIMDTTEKLFQGIESPFTGGLYHSWGISDVLFPSQLIITAQSEEGRIMALRHQSFDIRGVQFHPESIMTPRGEKIIRNWLDYNF